ncbi:MAG TPA: hypothetical protein VI818_00325, partial [Candidatus Thermoplasmatota archaeon]|nr:hypothetical protein [Candidatus Thermoplasmatota archaeon]
MGLVWNWLALPAVLSFALATAACLVLLLLKPVRTQNRRLALLLFLDMGFAAAASGFTFVLTRKEHAYAMQLVAMVLVAMLPFAYLRFLATIDSPLARPLRNPFVDGALLALLALVPTWCLLNPEFFVVELYEPTYAT